MNLSKVQNFPTKNNLMRLFFELIQTFFNFDLFMISNIQYPILDIIYLLYPLESTFGIPYYQLR